MKLDAQRSCAALTIVLAKTQHAFTIELHLAMLFAALLRSSANSDDEGRDDAQEEDEAQEE